MKDFRWIIKVNLMKLFEKLKNIKEPTKEWFFSWKMKKDYYREQKNNIDKDLSSKKGNG